MNNVMSVDAPAVKSLSDRKLLASEPRSSGGFVSLVSREMLL